MTPYSFQGNLLTVVGGGGGDRGSGDEGNLAEDEKMIHGSCIVIFCKVQTLVHIFYRAVGHAEGHCSEIKGLHTPQRACMHLINS